MNASDQSRPLLGGRYELFRRLARGGMAEVFLGRDQLLDRPVAVKVLFKEFSVDGSFVERFRREAQAAANLSHPNVVGVYDWGIEDGTHYIVMEFVDGRSLAEIIRSEGPLHPDRAADIAIDVTSALAFAHNSSVIHRDIKPGNVLLTTDGRVKVADFGIARAITGASAELTQTGSVMGTATYLSPEQARGYEADQRSDLYALAVVLYEMLTSGPPFTGDNAVSIAYKHVREAPAPPSQFNADIGAALEAVCLRGLAKDPEDRFESAEEMRRQLELARDQNAGANGSAADAAPAAPEAGVSATAVLQPLHAQSATTPDGNGAQTGSDATPVPSRVDATGAQRLAATTERPAVPGLVGSDATVNPPSGQPPGPAPSEQPPPAPPPPQHTGAVPPGYPPGGGRRYPPGPPPPMPPPMRRGQPAGGTALWATVVVTLVLIIGALVAALLIVRNNNVVGEVPVDATGDVVTSTLQVPQVVGLSYEDADRALVDAGFTLSAGFTVRPVYEEREGVDENLVFQQDPRAGVEVDASDTANNTITLFVSSAAQIVEVPNVVGLLFEDAEARLVTAGLQVNRLTTTDPTVEAGLVLEQTVRSGDRRPEGTEVTVTVSSGPGVVTVPNVVGQTQNDAQVILARLSLITLVRPENSTTFPDGSVIRTSPTSGESAERNSLVTLFVSAGPAMVVVPSLEALGSTVPNTVEGSLQALGLNTSFREVEQPADHPQINMVAELIPAPGSSLVAGSEVVIVVNVPERTVVMPSLTELGTTDPAEVEAALAALELTSVRDTYDLPEGDERIGQVVDLTPVAGTVLVVRSHEAVTIFVGAAEEEVEPNEEVAEPEE